MANLKTHIPVFLPGSNHDWEEIAGVASIEDTGDINIKLYQPEHAAALVEQMRSGALIAVAFDYIPEGEKQ